MKPVEALQETFHLPMGIAEFIASVLLPGEEVVTEVEPKMQAWLKIKAKETDYEFLAVTTRSSTLYIYVWINTNTIEALPFDFRGSQPLDELWRASIAANFKDHFHTKYITFTPHRPN